MKIATIKSIQALFNYEISTSRAWRYLNDCRIALDKQNKILTIEEFCTYHKIPL